MFIRSAGPLGAAFNNGQGLWGPSLDTTFAFDLGNPDLFLRNNLQSLHILSGKQAAFCAGLQNMATGRSGNLQPDFNGQKLEPQPYQLRANDFDQSMVWFQNMDDPNDAFRGQPGSGRHHSPNEFTSAPGQGTHHVPLPISSRNNHGNVRGRYHHHTNLNPSTGGLKTEAGVVTNVEDLWGATSNSTNFNHNFPHPQPNDVRGSQRWPHGLGPSNEYMQGYSFPERVTHGLPIFPNNQAASPSFDLGASMGGVHNVDSSSSSSCRVNGSSPNTVFGSFSSSIGPPDMMDMDVAEECFHSPPVFPADIPPCQNPGAIPQAFLSRSPANNLGITPGVVFSEAETVSPKMLHLNNAPSLPSSSSSESLPNTFRMDSDSEGAAPISVPHEGILRSSAWQTKCEPGSKLNRTGRKQLPDKAPHPKTSVSSSSGPKRRHGGEAAGDKSSAPSSKKSKPKTKALSQPQSQSQSQSQSISQHHHQHYHHHHHHQKGIPNPRANTTHSHATTATSSLLSKATTSAGSSNNITLESSTTPPRSERDEFLVQSKLAGMTYKDIRKKGGFTEAESTLRGRFRTLTKPKEARVRKPEFQEIDDKLLKRAVIKFTKDADEITRDNVHWKLVAEYMIDHGGSYLFGYTTVRKRWEYLMVTSDEQVRQDRLDHKFQL